MELLKELYSGRTTYKPYFDSLPGREDVLSAETLEDSDVSLLQDPKLVGTEYLVMSNCRKYMF